MGRLSLFALASFWLFMASMAVAAIWLVEPAKAESLAAATGHETASLTIHIERVSAQGGMLRLGVYDAARYANDKASPVASADVPAASGIVTISLKDLPPGRYAVETFQDINSNNKMDVNWLGVPLEPYGFSRDAKPFLSKPKFDAVAFTLSAGENSQTLHLQNTQAIATAGF